MKLVTIEKLQLVKISLISLVLFNTDIIEANIRDPHVGGICHVEAEYFYPGVWEPYGENQLICNYWKFLGDTDKKILESELNNETQNDNESYDYYDKTDR